MYFLPRVSRIPLHQGLTWEPTLQVIPKSGVFSRYLESLGVKRDLAKSSFPVLPLELMAFTHLMRFVRAYGEEWSQGTLWTKLTRYALSLQSFRLYRLPFQLGQLGPFI